MIIICIAETISWQWLPSSHESWIRHACSGRDLPTYVVDLPPEMERGNVTPVLHDADRRVLGSAKYLRYLLRDILELVGQTRFLLVYEPAFLRGTLPAPHPVQGVGKEAQAHAARFQARPLNWLTGVPLWCDTLKAQQVLDDLDRQNSSLHFVQAYCTIHMRDYLHPTNVLMLESCEDVYMPSFSVSAETCNVLVMPWQSHCARLFEFLSGGDL